MKAPGRFLLAVGDDWQSINRFAGADLSVMTDFEAWFGRGCQLALTTTFRCTQTICDVARTFVSKNPNQFNKPMRSAHHDPGAPVTVIRADDVAGALASYLGDLSAAVADGSIPSERSGKVSVDVLGRYRFERDVLPGTAVKPARHVPDRARVQGAGGRLHRAPRHDHRHATGSRATSPTTPCSTWPCLHPNPLRMPRNAVSSMWR